MQSAQKAIAAARQRIEKNLRFGIARGLTQTARQAQERVTADLPTIFDQPTPFTQKAIGFKPATRAHLEATVFVRPAQARYLAVQERGGTRTPQPGSPITLPVNQRRNQFGNIPRGAIAKEKAKPNTFVSTGKGRTAHLPPGIYERPKKVRRRDGNSGTRGALRFAGKGKAVGGKAAKGAAGLKLLVAFKRQASYRPQFGFKDRVLRVVKSEVKKNVERSILDAMRTMR